MLTQRRVTAIVVDNQGRPWPDGVVTFLNVPGNFTATHHIPSGITEGYVNQITGELGVYDGPEGAFQAGVPLWCDGEGELGDAYVCTMPSRETFPFVLSPAAETPTDLTTLHIIGITEAHPQYQTILQIIENQFLALAQPTLDAAVTATGNAQGAADAANDAAANLDATATPLLNSLSAGLDTLEDAIEASITQTLLAEAATEDSVAKTALTVTATGEANQARDAALAAAEYSKAYDIPFRLDGSPAENEEILVFPVVRPFSLPVGLAGSVCFSDAPATAQVVLPVTKNGVQFGTLTFAAGAAMIAPASAAGASFVNGDVLRVLGAAAQDVTLSNLRGTLKGVQP